ncbi:selenium-dependent molybdenum cofactor biosynthesis protein YqeB [Listeria sp. PSOL-1]|uniref:selenium-dependent molybdenum cofactor biosynthesis protein YqeB n=1 Tax=Listeria sp. PSOL-1 TaxID=1844999 RepID=UPI0013D37CAD|nr:selenium-dependent molybdenum cofactor biosynthesis protein YqeB [Listeria sp. PSOL-1]
MATGPIVIVRGGGDIATGVIQKLWHAGFRVLVLEIASPLTIRRTVALSTAVTKKETIVEDMYACLIEEISACPDVWRAEQIPILIDPKMESVDRLKPAILVDAILAKKNLGTTRQAAKVVIALGPGFVAGKDVDCVIETMRGPTLGRLILDGPALPDTKTPGLIAGKSHERVIHAATSGILKSECAIGDYVQAGEILFYIDDTPMTAPFNGIIRGLIGDFTPVEKGLKVADIDPRLDVDCDMISDKARAIGGAVLDASLYLLKKVSKKNYFG